MVAKSRPVTIAITSRALAEDVEGLAKLRSSGVLFKSVNPSVREEALVAALADAMVVIAGTERYTRKALERLPHLRLIARTGVGFDSIDMAAASRLGIAVTTTPGMNAHGVAEHSLAILLSVLHRTAHYDARVRDGLWRDSDHFPELRGLTIGIIGMGAVGTRFSQLLRDLACRIVAFDPYRQGYDAGSSVLMFSSLEEMLPECDVLSLHVPLTPETRYLIGARELSLLPRGAVLVNTSRGGVVDEQALALALRDGHVSSAAVDVFESEPPSGSNPLVSAPNCLLSPHVASLGRATVREMSQMVAGQIEAFLRGEVPDGAVQLPSSPRPEV